MSRRQTEECFCFLPVTIQVIFVLSISYLNLNAPSLIFPRKLLILKQPDAIPRKTNRPFLLAPLHGTSRTGRYHHSRAFLFAFSRLRFGNPGRGARRCGVYFSQYFNSFSVTFVYPLGRCARSAPGCRPKPAAAQGNLPRNAPSTGSAVSPPPP